MPSAPGARETFWEHFVTALTFCALCVVAGLVLAAWFGGGNTPR